MLNDKKICSACKKEKNISEFYLASTGKYGVQGNCKECSKKTVIKCRIKNKEKYNKYINEWHKKFRKTPKGRYHVLKTDARLRKKDFNLEKEEFIDWYIKQPKSCYYCGIKEDVVSEWNNGNGKRKLLEIDRKNNFVGYQINNMVLCCHVCNTVKGYIFSASEMKEIAEKYIKPKINKIIGGDNNF